MKNNSIFIIIGIIIVVSILFIKPTPTKERSTSIIISAYDSEGNLLGQVDNTREALAFSRGDLQSVYDLDTAVQLPAGTTDIKLTIVVKNTGNVDIDSTYISGILEQT